MILQHPQCVLAFAPCLPPISPSCPTLLHLPSIPSIPPLCHSPSPLHPSLPVRSTTADSPTLQRLPSIIALKWSSPTQTQGVRLMRPPLSASLRLRLAVREVAVASNVIEAIEQRSHPKTSHVLARISVPVSFSYPRRFDPPIKSSTTPPQRCSRGRTDVRIPVPCAVPVVRDTDTDTDTDDKSAILVSYCVFIDSTARSQLSCTGKRRTGTQTAMNVTRGEDVPLEPMLRLRGTTMSAIAQGARKRRSEEVAAQIPLPPTHRYVSVPDPQTDHVSFIQPLSHAALRLQTPSLPLLPSVFDTSLRPQLTPTLTLPSCLLVCCLLPLLTPSVHTPTATTTSAPTRPALPGTS
ncbi:hypothetical protein C8R45DRAFT_1208960 [Mycena sanguinolenta]|nr:hypothetical protein C8R45DRAFT_1208960 [Mycena sanguinolenta]